MTILRNPQNGLPAWEDAASEPAFRRMQKVRGASGPRSARTLPGMPPEAQDFDDDDEPRRRLFEPPPAPWWRPTTIFGRILLASGVLGLIGACVTGWVFTARALERDGRFRIAGTQNIQGAGTREVTRADLLPVFGEDIGRNIFFVHLAERRRQLEQIPWVRSATVMRFLPDQIRVSVLERTPIAFVRHGQQIGLVDAEGVLLSMPANGMSDHPYSFPVVTGIDARDPLASRHGRMAVYQRLISELDADGRRLSEQISEIDLSDPEDARVLMPEQGADIVTHFGDEQFLTRYQRYKQHIAEWRQQYPQLAAVDLRFDSQVVLKMAPGSATPQLAVSAGDGKPAADTSTDTSADTAAAKAPGKPTAGTAGVKPTLTAKLPATKSAVHRVVQHPKPGSRAASAHDKKKHPDAKRAAVPKHAGVPNRAGDPNHAGVLTQAVDPKHASDPKRIVHAKPAARPAAPGQGQ